MSPSSAKRVCPALTSVVLILLVLGCVKEPVREDRTIGFSHDGGQVAFQHGHEGVYVADRNSGAATKIFQPDETVLATSRPLTSPTDGRLIFATAQPLKETDQRPSFTSGPVPADGQIVSGIPIRFTCWLRDEPTGDQRADVKKLFRATCGHVGYVSAGLVVRWHPDGKHILYVAALDDEPRKHTIFEYDLESEQTRRIFPFVGDAVLCDWTPNGSALVCVVGNADKQKRSDASSESIVAGIWIGTPEDKDSWWHVPESEQLSQGELPSLIESLRANRPAWTPDDSQFVFVSRAASAVAEAKVKHRLLRVEFASRTLSTVAESDGPVTDLHWSPDGQRLGFLTHPANVPAVLKIREPTGTISDVAIAQPIRKFAGFDSTSQRLAYVAASPMNPPLRSPWWALLLLPDPLARDSVWIADAAATGPGTEVFSGTRVTFPLWSPSEERLSLWLTFTPQYRSLLSIFGRWGLWPGDPAATIDVRSGEVSWLAVTPQEELQIGHFHLLKHNHAEAWRWYAQARNKLPAARAPQNWTEFTQHVSAPENSQAFEYLCLKRLGRDDEATAKWLEFEQNFFPPLAAEQSVAAAPDATDVWLGALGPQAELLKHLLHDLYVAEVFLSVDAVDDALTHFRAQSAFGGPPANPDAALSRGIVLGQLLLIANDHDGYLSHCTSVVAPLAIEMRANFAEHPPENAHFVLQMAAGLCVAPLFRTDFLSGVSDAALQQNIPIWKDLRDRLSDGLPALAVDLFLRAAALNRDDQIAATAAEERIASNPAGRNLFADKSIDEGLAGLFELSQLSLVPSAGRP